jgi:hypothetical protein
MARINKPFLYLSFLITAVCGCKDQAGENPVENTVEINSQQTKTGEGHSFQKSLQFKNASFDIHTIGKGSLRKLFIQSKGFEKNESLGLNIDGEVTDANVADLNADGFPELLIFVRSAGSGSYGSIIAFSANGAKSISRAHFPPVSENPKLNKGYMGHDKFSVVGTALIQEYPVYQEGDGNATPTGGMRKVEYKLVDGEASRMFVVEKISENKI